MGTGMFYYKCRMQIRYSKFMKLHVRCVYQHTQLCGACIEQNVSSWTQGLDSITFHGLNYVDMSLNFFFFFYYSLNTFWFSDVALKNSHTD